MNIMEINQTLSSDSLLKSMEQQLYQYRREFSNYKIELYDQIYSKKPSPKLIQLWSQENDEYISELGDNLNEHTKDYLLGKLNSIIELSNKIYNYQINLKSLYD